MHFQQPELLYALIFLLIPLIVHLFRLRKFQKEDFTNVKFLKKVIQETRKSSRLKKFLILLTRLFTLSCLILAFAKPFIPASDKALAEAETLIYLDNSFSMQAGSEQSSVLQDAIDQLITNLDGEGKYSLFTNTKQYFNRSTTELKSDIQNIEYSNSQLTVRDITLKAGNYFKDFPNQQKDLILISDFQGSLAIPSDINKDLFNWNFVLQRPAEVKNTSIDTAFISKSSPESISLHIKMSTNINLENPVSVSVYDGDKLLGRNTVEFSKSREAEINFRLQNTLIANGRISLEDNGLKYDNDLYFNINEKTPVKVVTISKDQPNFLERIFSMPEFEIAHFKPDQIDFNSLNSANLVVLNEIDKLPNSLVNNIATIRENGASVIIIPSTEAQGYEQLLISAGFNPYSGKVDSERLITDISFDHPLLEDVFEERIQNFEYPKVLQSYDLTSSNVILQYQDGKPFLAESNSVFLFTAALNERNSNFRNSPLIVPVFYQIGLKALKPNELYYTTQSENLIDIPSDLNNEEVLHLVKTEIDVIPLQQNFNNRVEINISNLDLEAGNYTVISNNKIHSNISFNYPRAESDLNYIEISNYDGVDSYDSVAEYFKDTNAATQITALWKWFVIFALIFLGIEMLLIKFLK